MEDDLISCMACSKNLPPHLRLKSVKCFACNGHFHVKCTSFKSNKEYLDFIAKSPWFCRKCKPSPVRKSTKCKKCKLAIKRDKLEIKFFTCKKFSHSKCSRLSFEKFRLNKFWVCYFCTRSTLPFSTLKR